MIAVSGAPVLSTDRLVLRVPTLADFEPVAAYYASARAAHTGGSLPRDKAWRAFGHMVGHWLLRGYGMFFFAPHGAGPALGMTGPWFPEGRPERELGWVVFSAEAEGRGYAREAAEAARAHAFDTLGWSTAVSYIHPDNARSIALALRLGAVLDPEAAVPEDMTAQVYRHPRGRA